MISLARPRALAVPLAALVLAACEGEEAYDPSAEACEHTQEGPAAAATAGEVDDSTAPNVSAEHTRHDVTFIEVDGGNGGFARFESEGGEHIVFLTKDVPVTFAAPDGTAIASESVAETLCPEVVVAKHVLLPVGIVSLSFGPTTETAVSLVIEPALGHEEEHAE